MAFSSIRRGRRAVIVGGSMSGLFTAAFLRRIGWDVDVFERSPVELVGRGAGITTHPELLDALEQSGAGTLVNYAKYIGVAETGKVSWCADRVAGSVAGLIWARRCLDVPNKVLIARFASGHDPVLC